MPDAPRAAATDAITVEVAESPPTATPTAAPVVTPTLTAALTPTAMPAPTVAVTPTAIITSTIFMTPTTGAIAGGNGDHAGEKTVDLQKGIDIYLANYCGLCHTLTVAGTKGIFGPVHDGLGPIAEARLADPTYSGTATTPAEYIYESLVDPRAFVSNDYKLSRHPMPAFTHLSEDDLNALVALLVAQQ